MVFEEKNRKKIEYKFVMIDQNGKEERTENVSNYICYGLNFILLLTFSLIPTERNIIDQDKEFLLRYKM